jgi:translation initiation factor IF-3
VRQPPFGDGRGTGALRASHAAAGSADGGIHAQGGHISAEARINERIRAPEVRLVGPKGEQIGIVSINDALKLAQEADLDLVEVAPTARPPVAKLMDYGKFKYEAAVKARESRKNQTQTIVKEIKLRPKIDPHDYATKKGHVERFLKAGDKVKVTIMFRGREQSRPELGFRLLQRLSGDVEELGFVESQPKQDGRNMIMVIGPHKKKNEAKAHAGQSHSKSVPSPRPSAQAASDSRAAQAAPDSRAAQAAPDSRAAQAAPDSRAAQAAPDSRAAIAEPEPAANEPAADGAAVPGPA